MDSERAAGPPRGRSLAIANTSAVSASGAFAGVVLDEAQRLLEGLGSVDVTIFAPRGIEVLDAPDLPSGLRVRLARLGRGAERLDRPLRLVFEIPSVTRSLLGSLRRDPVDVLRADDTVATGLGAALVAKLRGIPFYVFLAGSVPETAGAKLGAEGVSGVWPRTVRWLEGLVLRSATGVLAVNRTLAAQAKAQGATLVATSNSFVDDAQFRRAEARGSRGGATVVRFAGRLEREKGIFDLLEAFARLAGPDGGEVRLEYVGGGSQQAALAAEIERRSLQGRVTVRGPVAHDEMPGLLASTDILVLPSYTEGSPVVVFEAMLMGVPVVATRVGSLPDVFRDGEDIVFVDIGHPESLAAGLRRLVEDPDLRRRMGAAGAETAGALVGAYVPTQLDFIDRVIAAHAAGESGPRAGV